ncbi:jg3651 [Pararge aegeria aegeria]|uniref:Jg3651 protein n=1 Tax=Pararge aegeria aegeria TaxID=348720 RepID=A0A8S4RFL6_9NEOP|nr:jg3651 [Pararge aegeria aegeria]
MKLFIGQRMRWSELCLEYLYVIRNEEIRRRTRVTGIAQLVAKLKWQWAEHIAWRTNGHWSLQAIQGIRPNKRRPMFINLRRRLECIPNEDETMKQSKTLAYLKMLLRLIIPLKKEKS